MNGEDNKDCYIKIEGCEKTAGYDAVLDSYRPTGYIQKGWI